MQKRATRVWDLPVRVFHTLFTVGWLAALVIALGVSRSSLVFPYHSLIGLTLAFALVLRLAWGVFGTRPARLGALLYSPRAVILYLRDALRWKETSYAWHNPASAWAIVVMFLLTVMQILTGLAVGSGVRQAKDFHAIIAYIMIAVIVVHTLGVALHTARHKELIALSMVDGKRACDPADGIASSRPWAGFVFMALVALFGVSIYRSYNPRRQTTVLPLVNKVIPIGESEEIED